jgi:hypothetical protein
VHPSLVYDDTKQHVKLDTYIPSMSLAFEYQGIQHYTPASGLVYGMAPCARDSEKRKICGEAGLMVVEVCSVLLNT